jgi:hypothetical protein
MEKLQTKGPQTIATDEFVAFQEVRVGGITV